MDNTKTFENYECKTFPLTEVKLDDETGTFTGYASIFDVVDTYGDSVDPGAFKRTLKNKGKWPLFYAHNSLDLPVGTIGGEEDAKGLWVRGKLTQRVQKAAEVRELMLDEAITGLSIGYQTVKEFIDKATGIRHLKEINLWEISLCCFQACPGALVDEVKDLTLPGSALATPAAEDSDSAKGYSFTELAELITKVRENL